MRYINLRLLTYLLTLISSRTAVELLSNCSRIVFITNALITNFMEHLSANALACEHVTRSTWRTFNGVHTICRGQIKTQKLIRWSGSRIAYNSDHSQRSIITRTPCRYPCTRIISLKSNHVCTSGCVVECRICFAIGRLLVRISAWATSHQGLLSLPSLLGG